MTKKKGKGTEL